MKTPRVFYFINQFASGHQYYIYNHKGKLQLNKHSKINTIESSKDPYTCSF